MAEHSQSQTSQQTTMKLNPQRRMKRKETHPGCHSVLLLTDLQNPKGCWQLQNYKLCQSARSLTNKQSKRMIKRGNNIFCHSLLHLCLCKIALLQTIQWKPNCVFVVISSTADAAEHQVQGGLLWRTLKPAAFWFYIPGQSWPHYKTLHTRWKPNKHYRQNSNHCPDLHSLQDQTH